MLKKSGGALHYVSDRIKNNPQLLDDTKSLDSVIENAKNKAANQKTNNKAETKDKTI